MSVGPSSERNMILSNEGPMLETLDFAIQMGSIPNFLYFDAQEQWISSFIPTSISTIHSIPFFPYFVTLNCAPLDVNIAKSTYRSYFISWTMTIYKTSFNFVQKYEIRIFHFMDILTEWYMIKNSWQFMGFSCSFLSLFHK